MMTVFTCEAFKFCLPWSILMPDECEFHIMIAILEKYTFHSTDVPCKPIGIS